MTIQTKRPLPYIHEWMEYVIKSYGSIDSFPDAQSVRIHLRHAEEETAFLAWLAQSYPSETDLVKQCNDDIEDLEKSLVTPLRRWLTDRYLLEDYDSDKLPAWKRVTDNQSLVDYQIELYQKQIKRLQEDRFASIYDRHKIHLIEQDLADAKEFSRAFDRKNAANYFAGGF